MSAPALADRTIEPDTAATTPARRLPTGPAWLAAALTIAVFWVSNAVRGRYPFGSLPRGTNDLGAQIVPMHAHLWDLLHGEADGDALFNWQSGFGVPFLPDFVTYLGSPLSLLVGVFPRDRVELAVFVITTLKLALAGAAMAVYLRALHRGPVWLAGALGAAYATCGWAIDDAAYVPMWLDGLIALPLFCLVAEWSLRRRRLAPGIALIALFWASNFYTAYMATLAAGVVLLARLASTESTWTGRLRGLLRYGLSVGTGIAVTAPLLVPTFLAAQAAQPTPPGVFRPMSADIFLSRLLPLTEGVGRSASLYVGTAALVLALTLPMNRAVPGRTRAAWTVTVLALAGSFQWAPTHALWHGFDTPNGSPFRQAFVLCGVLVVMAWLSFTHGIPDLVALAGAVAAVAVLAVLTRDSPFLDSRSVAVAGAGTLVVAALLTALRRAPGRRLDRAGALLLIALIAAETTATAVVVDRERAEVLTTDPGWGAQHARARVRVAAADGWPGYRTDLGDRLNANDPMWIGGQGAGYYSSLMPADTSRALTGLGFGWIRYGRDVDQLDDPLADAVFAVGARPDRSSGTGPAGGAGVPSLVTVRPSPSEPAGDGVFARYDALLAAPVFEVPPYRVTPVSGTAGVRALADGHSLRPLGGQPGLVRLDLSCRPGSVAYLWAPRLVGRARIGSDPWRDVLPEATRRGWPGVVSGGALVRLGSLPAGGSATVTLSLRAPLVLDAGAVGCLDPARFAAAVAALRSVDADDVRVGGHTITASFARPSTGTAVVAVPALRGWRCATDGGQSRPPDELAGLLAVRMTEPVSALSCTYRPPGLGLGLLVGALAALLTAALAAGPRLFRYANRRSGP